jgi:murein DD-endopeptidase MepM/ murein hydrolase activator NlpD
MVGRRTVGSRVPGILALLVLTSFSLTGCREAAVRYNSRAVSLLQQSMPGALPIPVDGVVRSQLRNTWHAARFGGRRHLGIDILAPRNTPIRSVTEGIVELKGMRGLGGQIMTITGPGGYRHYYAHLEEYGPQAVGDWVEAGEIIGYVGTSGNAAMSPPHLHYGIYAPSGRAVNPFTYLRESDPFALREEQLQTASK